jgi:hypothetical protein
MKISQARLKEIIREELQTHIQEQEVMARSAGSPDDLPRSIEQSKARLTTTPESGDDL